MSSRGDYKWEMQLIAEEIAEQRYQKDFYDLPTDLQMEVYGDATVTYTERLCDAADYHRHAEREGK